MPNSTPKQQIDLEDLALHEGATVLLRRALAQLRAGIGSKFAEIRPSLPSSLRHGAGKKVITASPSWVWPECTAYNRPDSRRQSPRLACRFAKRPIRLGGWPLAARESKAADPSSASPCARNATSGHRELNTIYGQATANQWSVGRDVPWEKLPKLPMEVEHAVAQIMTFLTENEFAALYVPARFIPRIHPHYREVVEVLAMQVVDEARHAEAFTRRAEAGGAGLGTTAVSGQLSLKTLLEEPDFTTATFLLCVMGEGTFLTLLKFLAEHAPDPVTAALALLAHRDEARHVAFGIEHMRYVFEREPEKRLSLTAAVERRSQMLASISGLSPYVHDALVIYAGGGVSVEQIRKGARHVAELQREMDRTRRERLQSLGFEPAAASQMSAYHTKNFM